MSDLSTKRRVQKLLEGELHQNLDRLFLFARDRCDGRECIQEIGDFVAHHSERQNGLLTRAAKQFFVVANFKIERLNKSIELSDLPPEFPDVMYASERALTDFIIKRDTGISKKHVRKQLPDLLAKFAKKPDGRYTLTRFLTETEYKIVKCLCSYLVSEPAFDRNRLIEDFCAVLKSNSAVEKDDIVSLKKISDTIALYAASCMHLCKIILSPHQTAVLSLRTPDSDGTLTVMSTSPLPDTDFAKIVQFSYPIFMTGVIARTACTHSLLSCSQPWDFPIYLNNAGLLDVL